MIKRNWLITLLIFSFSVSIKGQDSSPPLQVINKFISVEAGGIYYGFRDQISSVLFYEGLGGGHIGTGYKRDKNNIIFDDIRLSLEYGEVKAKENDPNDFVNIISFSASYSRIKKFNPKKHQKVNFFAGGTFSIDGIYISYPLVFSNNGDAYSADLLALSPVSGISFSPGINTRNSFKLLTQIQLISLNLRPESYSGIGSDKILNDWKVTPFYNNLKIKNTLSYEIVTNGKRHFNLSYSWLFIQNNSRVNALTFAQHNFTFGYQFKLKSNKK